MSLPSQASAMFGGATGAALAEKFESYKDALNKAPNTADGTAALAQVDGGQKLEKTTAPATVQDNAVDTLSKALGDDAVASLRESLAAQRADIRKDWSTSVPVGTGLVQFDLEAPAKMLVPVQTPLRNKLPRKSGVGTARQYKRITGFSNAINGPGIVNPGIGDGTQNNFAGAGLNPEYQVRGPKISYTGDDKSIPYFQFSLSDQVYWSAQFAGQGYENIRQLSNSTVLYASMLAEERMTLLARGTADGLSGALAVPTVTGADGADSGSLTASTAYDIGVAASSGFGTSAAGTASHTLGTTATSLKVSWNAVTGATGYDVYVGASGGTKYFVTHVGAGTTSYTFDGPVPTTGATAPTADTSANAHNYDGIVPICLGADSGYHGTVGGQFAGTPKGDGTTVAGVPGNEYQLAFEQMYSRNLADPDEILINGSDRKQLSDALRASGSANYRLNIAADGTSGHQLGNIVVGLQNEVTGKMVDLTVHPYLPQGISPILTHNLPFPNSEVDSCWTYVNVQDYMGVQWPVTQFTYDVSSYWYGTMLCYAPAWQGILTGIAAA